jgi:hypothetical protein
MVVQGLGWAGRGRSLELAPRTFDLGGLSRREPSAVADATAQAEELVRALAALGVIIDKDAVVEEVDARARALLATLWPERPLDGYQLHGSLGAYAIAKVAVAMVPAGSGALRHEPLKRTMLVHHLVEGGAEEATVASVLGDWAGASADFVAEPRGLDVSRLAGLAERTLTRSERDLALAQVAWSPRCLARFAATLQLLAATRRLLPLFPSSILGHELGIAAAGLALGRPERVLELLGARAERGILLAFRELAAAQWALARREAAQLEPAPELSLPEFEPRTARADAPVVDGAERASEDDEDDVLQVVEERIAASASADLPRMFEPAAEPRPAQWAEVPPLSSEHLSNWKAARADAVSVTARRRTLLGLALLAPPPTSLPVPIPPDVRVLASHFGPDDEPGNEPTQRISWPPTDATMAAAVRAARPDPVEALAPPVRAALRAVVAAAEGLAPSAAAVALSGDLSWVLARARALALVSRGDLAGAREALSGVPDDAAPEGRWARERALRAGSHPAEPVSPEEARAAAAALVGDLAHQLARTIAGTVPTEPRAMGPSA